jgi:hypothetical protein
MVDVQVLAIRRRDHRKVVGHIIHAVRMTFIPAHNDGADIPVPRQCLACSPRLKNSAKISPALLISMSDIKTYTVKEVSFSEQAFDAVQS